MLQIIALDIQLTREKNWIFSVFFNHIMLLSPADRFSIFLAMIVLNNVLLFFPSLVECGLHDPSRHEDASSPCATAQSDSVEDGPVFRGASQGIEREYIYI